MAMVEQRNQILGMCFGMRSLKYLLEEKKLQECVLLGKNESIDDWLIPKFVKSEDVPRPRGYCSPLDTSPILGSPFKAPERTRFEDKGIVMRMHNMYSLNMLNTRLNQLVSFLRHSDHNFFIWANPDLIVHRYDEGLRSWQIKYSTAEHTEEYLNQYGTNEYKDLSHLTISVDNPPSTMFVSEHDFEPHSVSEPHTDPASRLPLSS